MTTACAPNMNWVMPYIIVEDAAEAAKFYRDVFGFEITMEMPDDSGKIIHVEMKQHDSIMMCGSGMADIDPIWDVKTPKQGGFKSPLSLYVYIEDVDAFYAKITSDSRVTSQREPEDQAWGDRMCVVLDPDGHQWSFATWSGKSPQG